MYMYPHLWKRYLIFQEIVHHQYYLFLRYWENESNNLNVTISKSRGLNQTYDNSPSKRIRISDSYFTLS